MNESIFRKKSLEKISSPESLNEYIRVSNPGVWLLLAAMILLLVGACVWGIFGTVESKVTAVAVVEDGQLSLYASRTDADTLKPGAEEKIRIGEEEYSIVLKPGTDEQWEGNVLIAREETALADGIYPAEIVVETFRPLSFVFN